MNIECLICSKLTSGEINCPYCSTNFCSYYCLESHFISNHSGNNNINKLKKNVYEKPKIGRIKNKKILTTSITSSPYITYGFITQKIIYDRKFYLDNFIPEIQNGEIVVIGTGSYGKVYSYRNKLDNKLYAIKHMNKDRLRKSLKSLRGIYNEINIQSKIFHKNIIRLLYVQENNNSFDLVMEYASGGSLFYYIREKYYLSEKESFKYFSQIVNAIYFLHKNDLIHRDIKPENILLYENGICKLCDFGWCVKLDGRARSTFCGTTEYMSPEIVNKMEYSKEIDVWSLGILLYEMVHGYSPFRPDKAEFNANDVIRNIKIHDLKFDINISHECRELICHLLDENVENRYKIEDIFNSKFFKKYEKKKLFFPEESNNTLQTITINTLTSIKDNTLPNINNSDMKNKNNNILTNINHNLKDPNNNSVKNKHIIIKTSNNIINNINEKNENVNKSSLRFEYQKKKLKKYQSQSLLPSFLQNASMLKKESNDKTKDIHNNNYNNLKNENFKINNIIENSEQFEKSLEKKYKDLNKINLHNSASFIFNNNNQDKKLLNRHKNYSFVNNINNRGFNLNNENSKSKLDKNINNIKKETQSISISLINNLHSTNSEENNRKPNLTSNNDNIFYTNNQIVNKRKLNLRNYYKDKKENSKNKKSNENELKNLSFASVKKLTNEKKNDLINYNNYFITYRENSQNNKKYEKITIFNGFNNTQQKCYSERNLFGPKDNLKRKKNLSINTILNYNTNNSKERVKKRAIANSIKMDKISNFIDIDIFKNFKITPSLENNYNLNQQILNSENKLNTPKNKIYHNENLPIFTDSQYNNKFSNTFRKLSSNSIFNNTNYNSFVNNNFNKPQINTNYIFNPKISITLPSNPSSGSKSKNKENFSKNYKIIYIGKNLNKTNVKNISKSQPFLETNYLKFNGLNSEEKLKLYKNSNNKNKKEEINDKIEEHETPRFNTERELNKKIFCSVFKETEPNFLKNKKYIKMNEITKYKFLNDKNQKQQLVIKTKNDTEKEKNNLTSTKEGVMNINNKLQKSNKLMNEDKNSPISLRKINYKIKINNNIEENTKIKRKSKEKNNIDSFSERNLNKNNTKEKNHFNLFSARIQNRNRNRTKQLDNSKTPKKNEDKIKITPSQLLNNFSEEFNKYKAKGCK